MAQIIETLTIEEDKNIAEVNMNFDNRMFKLAKKISYDNFQTVQTVAYNELFDYCISEDIDGRTVYNIMDTVTKIIQTGDFKKFPAIIGKLNVIESELSKKKENFKATIEDNK